MTSRRTVSTSALASFALVLAAACGGGGGGAPDRPVADLVLRNGTIETMAGPAAGGPAEPTALAVADGRILAVGDDAEIRSWIGPATRVVDLDGAFAMPGFIEGHGHFLGLGSSLDSLDLNGLPSWSAVVAAAGAAAAAAEPGDWIVGRGWHQEKWERPPDPAVEGYPTEAALSAVSPDNPVLLIHASGHASMVNARALAAAGIDRDTPDPAGGRILHDARGRPTGALLENAEDPVQAARRAWAAARPAEVRRATLERRIDLAERRCGERGVTSFQDAGSDFGDVDALLARARAGNLAVRLWILLSEDNAALEGRLDQYAGLRREADAHLTVGGIKRWLDGALGSHGAWLLEPYSDLPSTSGLETLPLPELRRSAELALDHGLQLAVHAIGDRANRETLDLYEELYAQAAERSPGDPSPDLRWRIEHAQHLDPDDIPRFAALGVVASMQPVHCTSDGPWVVARLGERRAREGAYMWRALLDSGALVSIGTDVPVEPIDPIANFYAAVTRKMADGRAFYPQQAMTRAEALRGMTLDAARAAFEEDLKGSLEPGKLADIVALSADLRTVPEDRIRETRVLYTIVGGDVVYGGEP